MTAMITGSQLTDPGGSPIDILLGNLGGRKPDPCDGSGQPRNRCGTLIGSNWLRLPVVL